MKLILTFCCLLAICIMTSVVDAQSTAFSYQGHLKNGGAPANGNYEMQFKLFDSLAGGSQVGKTVTDLSVAVINGAFAAILDFDAAPFDAGPARFLEISVRPALDPNPYTVLSPRQPINSTPYAIQARNALTADNATNSLQLGGIDASEYVTTSSVGNAFIKNGTTLQPTSNFNISGNGKVGGSIGIGIDPFAGYKLDVNGPLLVRSPGTGGNMQLSNPNGESGLTISGVNRADVRFDGSALRLFVGTGTAIPTTGLLIDRFGNGGTSGNLGVGTFNPDTRLTLNGGPSWTSNNWTASMNLRNASAIGWDANPSGQRFGIGQSTGGLYFFRTFSSFGYTTSPSNLDMVITDTGNITQPRQNSGLVKAMLFVDANGNVVRCYNGITNSVSGECDFDVTLTWEGRYLIDFGFQIDTRFVSVTPQQIDLLIGNGVVISAGFNFAGPNHVAVRTYITDVDFKNAAANCPFMIIVF